MESSAWWQWITFSLFMIVFEMEENGEVSEQVPAGPAGALLLPESQERVEFDFDFHGA